MTCRAPLALAAVAVCVGGVQALAAEPVSGEVSGASPSITWKGHITEPTGVFELVTFFAGGTEGLCMSPMCDTFTLTVKDPSPEILHITIDGKDSDLVAFEVTDPKGNVTYVDDADVKTAREKDFTARPGTWTITTLGGGDFDYVGKATLQPAAGEPSPPLTTPTGSTTTPPAPKLTIAGTSASARKLARTRRLKVRLTTSAQLTKVTLALLKGRKVIASGRAARLASSGTVTLRTPKSLKAGSYRLVAAGAAADGSRATASRALKIKK